MRRERIDWRGLLIRGFGGLVGDFAGALFGIGQFFGVLECLFFEELDVGAFASGAGGFQFLPNHSDHDDQRGDDEKVADKMPVRLDFEIDFWNNHGTRFGRAAGRRCAARAGFGGGSGKQCRLGFTAGFLEFHHPLGQGGLECVGIWVALAGGRVSRAAPNFVNPGTAAAKRRWRLSPSFLALTGDEFVKDHANGEKIGASVSRMRVTEDFRGGVSRRSHDQSGA